MNAAATLSQAMSLLQQGRPARAEELCLELVRAQPKNAHALHLLGVVALQKGDTAGGISFLTRSLDCDPKQPHACCNLGNAFREKRQPDAALAYYRRALLLAPDFAGAFYGQGNALLDLDRVEEARASFEQALKRQRDYPEALNNLGNALLRMGNADAALESYHRALTLRPDFRLALGNCARALRALRRYTQALAVCDRLLAGQPDDVEALNHRGELLLELKRAADALVSLDRAVALQPAVVTARYNRASAYLALQQFDLALADFDEILRLRPDLAEALCNRGLSLLGLGRHDESLDSFNAALSSKPDFLAALDGRGRVLRILSRYEPALADFDRALQLLPSSPDILYRRAAVLRDLRRHEDAAQCFAQLLQVSPDYDYALGNLLHERLQICDWSGYAESLERVMTLLAAGRRVYQPGPFQSVAQTAAAQLQCASVFVADKLNTTLPPLWNGEVYRHEKIRVAYLSADFREHPVSILLAGVLERHDRARFETIGISLCPEDSSPFGQRIKNAFDRFIDVSGSSDRQVAELLRELEIDIAVDLMGFSGKGRPAILTHRPAPVQINYLGYTATTALACIDYIIVDPIVVPPAGEHLYTEKLIYLPHCYQPGDSTRVIAAATPTRAQCELPETGFVFCCFNNHYKINPPVFAIWMRLLASRDDSVLWLAAGSSASARNLRQAAAAHGIAPERLIFACRVPRAEDHLARHRLADLFLDTLPFNAHATASDALWAGLPVLTCQGDTFTGRVASSLLTAVGLPDLIASSASHYESLALELAHTPAVLTELRLRLAGNRDTQPLFDTQAYCRHLETAYTTVWQRTHQAQLPAKLIL